MTPSDIKLRGLDQSLIIEGLLSEEQAQLALQDAKSARVPFINHLIQSNLLSARDIAMVASQDFGAPFFDLDYYDRSYVPVDIIDESLIRKYQVLPLHKREQALFIAIADPSLQNQVEEIQFHTGLHVRSIVVDADKLALAIEEVLNAQSSKDLDNFLEESDDSHLELDITAFEEEQDDDSADHAADDAPIVKFVHKMLLDAVTQSASDIHFEPYEKSYRVRFRIDGILYDIANPAPQLANRIASRLKIMSQLDISERRLPQDGRFMMRVTKQRVVDFRVSTCPTVSGEKIVMRILDPSSTQIGLSALGLSDTQHDVFTKSIRSPQGLILVTGPTGSGKTVTLYTALNLLNEPNINISTAEDPVEIKVEGINQVNINTKTGLTFPVALRAFLRQDPDIIMVGEMRDLETAEIGIKAAQTGHLVLSTLHTNSAAETLVRLINMGVPSYNLAQSIHVIIAQRLARRLCEKCKEAYQPNAEYLKSLGLDPEQYAQVTFYKPKECGSCTQGYRNRVAIYEMMPITSAISELIIKEASSIDIEKTAKLEGMKTLYESGIEKAIEGLTAVSEINRVIKD